MEKRRAKRKYANLEAMLISRSLNYEGTVVNLADYGICISINANPGECQIADGMLFEVKFALPSEEEIYLQCKVVRIHRQLTGDMENIVAMKIINQPPDYQKFLNTRS